MFGVNTTNHNRIWCSCSSLMVQLQILTSSLLLSRLTLVKWQLRHSHINTHSLLVPPSLLFHEWFYLRYLSDILSDFCQIETRRKTSAFPIWCEGNLRLCEWEREWVCVHSDKAVMLVMDSFDISVRPPWLRLCPPLIKIIEEKAKSANLRLCGSVIGWIFRPGGNFKIHSDYLFSKVCV